ncbi:UNKNOWN [Stylonychia lemnae]|uniref:Uncharacterized protein n=1 Tax=Stylonychia lemnae TaxID=5949 RepID=A0A077ZWJ8_STYLE|nr:UNKNOWN [Stylonychia lemnae]|eukprot:CDW73956.1 UNKNOWN [Stylonychia lemnae]
MLEEFKSEYPEQFENDVNTKMALKSGFKAYKSEGLDYYLEHHETFPLTLVLFYDSEQLNDNVMKNLTAKLLDVFVYKYEKKLAKGNFNLGNGFLSSAQNISQQNNQSTFDQVLSLIYEDTFIEWVKMIFIDLNAQNILIPWIYLFYNDNFDQVKLIFFSLLSRQNMITELEIEFGYCTEEESIFQSFSHEMERALPKIKKTFTMKKDQKSVKVQFKDMIKRFTDKTRTFEFMVKFKVEMENNQDSSSIYSANGGTPLALIEEKEKKKFLKKELEINDQSVLFNKEIDEKKLIKFMLELIYKCNSLIDLINPNDSIKMMEMSINKQDIMLDKSKLVIIKLDKLFLVIPLTITKVETKLRNVFINQRPKMDGLARFMEFYLKTFSSPLDMPKSDSHTQAQVKKK